MTRLHENFQAARKSGVPLLAIATQDQPATLNLLQELVSAEGKEGGPPLLAWDCLTGLTPVNHAAKSALSRLGQDHKETTRSHLALLKIAAIEPRSVVVFRNAHHDLRQPSTIQGYANLREKFKEDKRMVVMLAPTFDSMPPELRADVVQLEEPLPSEADLGTIITELHEATNKTLDPKRLPSMVTALRGMPSGFAAEQVASMSFRPEGLNLDVLWERKQNAINQTKGLKISLGSTTFADLAGMDSIMGFLRKYQAGPRPFRLILFWDEIEKMMAGAGADGPGDSSGVSADFLQVVLKVMQRLRWAGMILLGVGGSGKTALADATAAEFGVPKIEMDFGDMKGPYVGNSEAAVRDSFRVVEGIGGSDVLVIATCNKLNTLPPEFRRRFWLGNWYFDLPSLEEQEPIKRIYERKLKITEKVHGPWPDTSGWTGAEISNCAELAVRLGDTLAGASRYIVPIAKADPDSVAKLRALAEGRFLSVQHPGEWRMADNTKPSGGRARRSIES